MRLEATAYIRMVSKSLIELQPVSRQRVRGEGTRGGDATRPQSSFPRCPVASMQVKERLPAGRRTNPHRMASLLP